MARFKLLYKSLIVFQHATSKQNLRKCIIYNSNKNTEFLGINLGVCETYTENCKTLLLDHKKNLNVVFCRMISYYKSQFSQSWVCRFSAVLIKIPVGNFGEFDKLILK
jgi:hypothetical protein